MSSPSRPRGFPVNGPIAIDRFFAVTDYPQGPRDPLARP
jgi:hypothetical protein